MQRSDRVGRFSDGQERRPEHPGNGRVGRFSDGQARDPSGTTVVGRFSTGQELLAETSEHVRVGSFGDVERSGRPSVVRSMTGSTEGLERVSL
jgi:hypothetical protein